MDGDDVLSLTERLADGGREREGCVVGERDVGAEDLGAVEEDLDALAVAEAEEERPPEVARGGLEAGAQPDVGARPPGAPNSVRVGPEGRPAAAPRAVVEGRRGPVSGRRPGGEAPLDAPFLGGREEAPRRGSEDVAGGGAAAKTLLVFLAARP
jgi:hypothetical protein